MATAVLSPGEHDYALATQENICPKQLLPCIALQLSGKPPELALRHHAIQQLLCALRLLIMPSLSFRTCVVPCVCVPIWSAYRLVVSLDCHMVCLSCLAAACAANGNLRAPYALLCAAQYGRAQQRSLLCKLRTRRQAAARTARSAATWCCCTTLAPCLMAQSSTPPVVAWCAALHYANRVLTAGPRRLIPV